MSSADGHDGPNSPPARVEVLHYSLEAMLFESLVHHLIEKGLLTKNDGLSVVQTVAEVKRAQATDEEFDGDRCNAELAVLRRLFDSFAAMREGTQPGRTDGHNIHQLRPPLHDGNPNFPDED